MVARVQQLNKWTINTHAALPSLHYVCSRRVAKLNDERVFLLCRKQFSNSFAVAQYFLLPERGVGVYFYHREFQADPQIAEIAILPSLMSSKGKLKLEGGCGSSADETSAQWSTGRMQILGRHNRKRATKACRSNSGDMTERALSKYPFRNRWKGISIALVWEVKTLRLSMQEYTMLGKRVIRFGGIEVANNNWNEVIRRARINQIKIAGIYKCFNKWLIEVTLFLKIFNWLLFQLGPKSDRCVRMRYSW